jgi:hypothetical protein
MGLTHSGTCYYSSDDVMVSALKLSVDVGVKPANYAFQER